MSCKNCFGLPGSRVSILTATTWKLGPPSLACTASSVGISLRHGTHQVAHKFSSTVRPLKSANVTGLPAASVKAMSGTFSGLLATLTAATSPRAKGASFLANSTACRQLTSFAGSPPTLLRRTEIPYTPASPTTTPAIPQDKTMARRFCAAADRDSVISEGPRRCGHEQQDVGRAVYVRSRRHHGGDQRLHRFRPASLPPGHRRVQGPCRDAGQARHHYGGRCEKDRSRSRHDPVRDRGR